MINRHRAEGKREMVTTHDILLRLQLNEYEKNNGHKNCPNCKGANIVLVIEPKNHLGCKDCLQEFFADTKY